LECAVIAEQTPTSVDQAGKLASDERDPHLPAGSTGAIGSNAGLSTIVSCVAYREGKRLPPFPIDDISEIIKQPDIFLWIGLYEPDDSLLDKMQEEFGLHELAMEDARAAHQRAKLETYGDSLFLVAKTATLVDNEIVFGETHLFAGKNYLISLRHGKSKSYSPVRASCEKNPQRLALGTGYAIYALLDAIVDNYLMVVSELRSQFNQIEADIFDATISSEKLQNIYNIKRELMLLRDAALPLVDICNELMRFHEDIIPKSIRVYLRDVQDHARRVMESCDNMREMLVSAMQINLAMVSIGQNDVVRQLAGWGAILALPTVVFSLYGMNFKFMPELNWQYSYFTVVGATVGGCIWLYIKLKKANWL
jgi:magnesium transporter